MNVFRRLLFGNWPLKLAALGLASVLYAGVALSENTRTWEAPVPIEVLGSPSGGSLLDNPGVVERISYRAPEGLGDQLRSDSFRASIDLSGLEPRIGAAPVTVPVDVFPVDPRVRVVDYSPRGVNVRLDRVVSRVMPAEIDTGAIPEGIELGTLDVEPNRVTVRGASSRLQNVRSVEGRVVVDSSGINIDQDVQMEAFDEVGALVPGVEIAPPSVRVRADVAIQQAYATLPVIPTLTGEPAPGKRVHRVSVLPATVTVSGESPAVRGLESVATEPVDIEAGESELVRDVGLELPAGVTPRGETSVRVVVTFTDDIASRAFEVGTALVGTRADRTYRIGDPSVSIVAVGPVLRLDEVSVEDFSVEVPVADLELGENEVMPIVNLPRGLSIARLVPETVRVTVGEPS